MAKTATIGIRMEEGLKAALERAAEADHRSLGSYIKVLIIKDLEAKGLWPKGSKKK